MIADVQHSENKWRRLRQCVTHPVTIGILVLGIFVSPFINLWLTTEIEISRIKQVVGRKGAFGAITARIRTKYHAATNVQDLASIKSLLGDLSSSNVIVYRFNGEGLPYFYGFVAYDTQDQRVVDAVVKRLW